MGRICMAVLLFGALTCTVCKAETNRPISRGNQCREPYRLNIIGRLDHELRHTPKNNTTVQIGELDITPPKRPTLDDALRRPGWWWHFLGAHHMPIALQRMWIKPDIDLAANYYGVMMGGVRF